MIYKLTDKDGIELVYTNENGEYITAVIPNLKIMELLDEEGYETISEPDCNCSSCEVNGFCECDPINTDVKLSHINVYINENN